MKTLKQFLNEGVISSHKGVKLFGTTHSQQREIERHVPKDALINIHKKIVDKIKSGEYTPTEHKSFMVHDKNTKHTVLMDYRKDKYSSSNDKHVFLVSAYGTEKEGNPRAGQDKIKFD